MRPLRVPVRSSREECGCNPMLYSARLRPHSGIRLMKLIGSLTSPYTRKVRIVAAEKRIDLELQLDNVMAADAKTPSFNPLG